MFLPICEMYFFFLTRSLARSLVWIWLLLTSSVLVSMVFLLTTDGVSGVVFLWPRPLMTSLDGWATRLSMVTPGLISPLKTLISGLLVFLRSPCQVNLIQAYILKSIIYDPSLHYTENSLQKCLQFFIFQGLWLVPLLLASLVSSSTTSVLEIASGMRMEDGPHPSPLSS